MGASRRSKGSLGGRIRAKRGRKALSGGPNRVSGHESGLSGHDSGLSGHEAGLSGHEASLSGPANALIAIQDAGSPRHKQVRDSDERERNRTLHPTRVVYVLASIRTPEESGRTLKTGTKTRHGQPVLWALGCRCGRPTRGSCRRDPGSPVAGRPLGLPAPTATAGRGGPLRLVWCAYKSCACCVCCELEAELRVPNPFEH